VLLLLLFRMHNVIWLSSAKAAAASSRSEGAADSFKKKAVPGVCSQSMEPTHTNAYVLTSPCLAQHRHVIGLYGITYEYPVLCTLLTNADIVLSLLPCTAGMKQGRLKRLVLYALICLAFIGIGIVPGYYWGMQHSASHASRDQQQADESSGSSKRLQELPRFGSSAAAELLATTETPGERVAYATATHDFLAVSKQKETLCV
jgi:hypothetical protein